MPGRIKTQYRAAILLPFLAVIVLGLWLWADLTREEGDLLRISTAEAEHAAAALDARVSNARHIGRVIQGLAIDVDTPDIFIQRYTGQLERMLGANQALSFYSVDLKPIGIIGATPPPRDLVIDSLLELSDRDAVPLPAYSCRDSECAAIAIRILFPGKMTLIWLVVSFDFPDEAAILPTTEAPVIWREGNRLLWPREGTLPPDLVDKAANDWFRVSRAELAELAISAQVMRPPESAVEIWARRNGGRFILLGISVLASFLLAGLYSLRLGRMVQRQQAMQADLTEQQRQLRAIFDLLPDAYLVHIDGVVIFANPGAQRIFRAESVDRLIGWDLIGAIGERWKDEARLRSRRIRLEGSITEPAIMQARRFDGTQMVIRVQGRPITFDGAAAALTAIYDITEQTMQEEARERARLNAEAQNRAKSDFLAHMSHELRTPLNSVIGFAELLKREHLGPLGAEKYRDYVDDILDSGRHLLALINDVLDWSRIEAGRQTLIEEDIDPIAIARVCLRSVSQIADERGITLVDHLDDGGAHPLLVGDARQVRQVILNLLSNAVKFTPDGGRVEIAARRLPDEGWEMSVRDTGIGIDSGDIERIFEPFTQADNSRQRRFEGTGLGLPLSRKLMQLHGGDLLLESTPGQGTVARMHFPGVRLIDVATGHDTAAHI